jgi:hypothetical protein
MIAAILAASMLVLTLPSSASAECAWVLWMREATKGTPATLSPLSAHVAKTDCETRVQEQVKAAGHLVPQGWETTVIEGGLMAVGPGGQTIAWSFTCLPDTVDPRGPKGTTR